MTKSVNNHTLWTVQALLALLFLFTGTIKLALPIAQLTQLVNLPGFCVRFLGTAEILAAFGLILPRLLRIRQELTSLAAICLTIIMIGAVTLTLGAGGGATALGSALVGSLLIYVARGRRVPARPAVLFPQAA